MKANKTGGASRSSGRRRIQGVGKSFEIKEFMKKTSRGMRLRKEQRRGKLKKFGVRVGIGKSALDATKRGRLKPPDKSYSLD